MSDLSRSESWQSNSTDFAEHLRSFPPHPIAATGGFSTKSPLALADSSAIDTVAGLVHDTRNMVMALELYCDLLADPGVLSAPFRHYAEELRLVSGASRRLMEKLAKLSTTEMPSGSLAPVSREEISAVNLLNFPNSMPNSVPSSVPSSVKDQAPRSSSLTAQTQTTSWVEEESRTTLGNGVEKLSLDSSSRSLDSPLPMRPGKAFFSESRIEQDRASGDVAWDRWRSSGPASVESIQPVEAGGAALWPRSRTRSRKPLELYMDRRIEDLAEELRANYPLLSALAGPGVAVELSISGGHIPIVMAPEDLTRVLVNLVRNAIEAMPGGGELQISLEEGPQFVTLSFADNGPGIPRDVLDKIFSPGYSSHSEAYRERDLTGERKPSPRNPRAWKQIRNLRSSQA